MSEKAGLEKMAIAQKQSRQIPAKTDSYEFIKNHDDLGPRESPLDFYEYGILGIEGVTDDGAIWIQGVRQTGDLIWSVLKEDRIVRRIREGKERIKIFVSKKEVYATVENKIILLDTFDQSTDYADVDVQSIESRPIWQTPSSVCDMSINEEFIVASFKKDIRIINKTAMNRALDKIRSQEKQSDKSRNFEKVVDRFQENIDDISYKFQTYGIEIVRKNGEGSIASVEIAGESVEVQISSQQVFVSANAAGQYAQIDFTFVWEIKTDAEQSQIEYQDTDKVYEEAFRLFTTFSSETLKPSVVIQGGHPKVNEHIVCLRTPSGVSIRDLEALDCELASMTEVVIECVPVPGSRYNVIIFNQERNLSFADIVSGQIVIKYTIPYAMSFSYHPNHTIVYNYSDKLAYFKALDRTLQSSSHIPLVKQARYSHCSLTQSILYIVNDQEDLILGSIHVNSFQQNQIKLPFTYDQIICLLVIQKTVLIRVEEMIYTYDAKDLSQKSVCQVTYGEIGAIASNSYCFATYVREEQEYKIYIYLISDQKLERVKTLYLTFSNDHGNVVYFPIRFLLDEDMKILLWDSGHTVILEDVMHKSEVKDRVTNISRRHSHHEPSLILDSYMIF